ncbi:MAG: RNA-directed DNA polymerase [Paraprevotella sp.]|nr:RNA-directed DNA polymerase [Paraprevotella sp.]
MDRICAIDNLLLAYYKAKRGKQQLPYVVEYSMNLFENIVRLRAQLQSMNIKIGRYRYFNIYDPKFRKICAAVFEERIMHHAIINICHPYFERHLIYDTYATRLGKGIYAAIDRAKIAMRQYGFVAKLDMKAYFDSISHDILKQKLRRIFKDMKLLALFDRIIDSYETTSGFGIPIGNLTSQYFANFYLSYLDHYSKEVVRIPCYIRYMDDILLFGSTSSQVREYVFRINLFVENELRLKLKQPVFCSTYSGVSFLGYSLFPHKILLNRRSKIRLKKKMSEYERMYAIGEWTDMEYKEHIIPLLAFAQKAYTKGLRTELCKRNS